MRRASAEELDFYKFPPRPDPERSPALCDFWARMFAPPLEFRHPEPVLLPNIAHLLRKGAGSPSREAGAFQFMRTRWGTSQNWSGGVLKAHSGMLFHRVVGRWTTPRPSAPQGVFANVDPPNDVWQGSFWIGFDGYFQWSQSLPQMGTVSKLNAITGQAETYAFGQWWVRDDDDNQEVRLTGFPVDPDDEIYCELTVRSDTEVMMHMVNRTQRFCVKFSWFSDRRKPGPKPQPGINAPVEGRTVTWCVERPSTLPTDPDPMQLFILPELEGRQAAFAEVLAEMRDPANPSNVLPRDLTGARFLRMVAQVPGAIPPRTIFLTSPTAPPQSPQMPDQMTVHQLD